jgi:hypothetical protein
MGLRNIARYKNMTSLVTVSWNHNKMIPCKLRERCKTIFQLDKGTDAMAARALEILLFSLY